MGFSARFRAVEQRDKDFINQMNLNIMNGMLWPLYVSFLCLDFLDVYSTLLAMWRGFPFRELNPIASTLFSLQFAGFLIAIALKYMPAIPLFYAVFAKDRFDKHPFEIRMVKFVALVALVSANMILVYIVAINNIPTLLRAVFSV